VVGGEEIDEEEQADGVEEQVDQKDRHWDGRFISHGTGDHRGGLITTGARCVVIAENRQRRCRLPRLLVAHSCSTMMSRY